MPKHPRFKFRVRRLLADGMWIEATRIWPENIDDVRYPGQFEEQSGPHFMAAGEGLVGRFEVTPISHFVHIPATLLPPELTSPGKEFVGIMSAPCEVIRCEPTEDT